VLICLLENSKRDFEYKGKDNIAVILIDDLVTSGETLLEAKVKLQEYNWM